MKTKNIIMATLLTIPLLASFNSYAEPLPEKTVKAIGNSLHKNQTIQLKVTNKIKRPDSLFLKRKIDLSKINIPNSGLGPEKINQINKIK